MQNPIFATVNSNQTNLESFGKLELKRNSFLQLGELATHQAFSRLTPPKQFEFIQRTCLQSFPVAFFELIKKPSSKNMFTQDWIMTKKFTQYKTLQGQILHKTRESNACFKHSNV